MSRRLRWISGVAVGALALVAPLSGSALAGENGGNGGNGGTDKLRAAVATLQVDEQTVEVKAKGAERFAEAEDGDELHVGDTVRTGSTGRAEIQYDDESYTRLDSDTTFKIQSLSDEQGNRKVEGSLEGGQVWNRAEGLSESESFEQTAASATAAVQGTAFAMSCESPTQCTFTAVVDDIVLTGADGLTKLLTPLDQCDSSSGVLCGDVTKIDPSQLGDWILENLILDLERGYPLPDFPVTFTVLVDAEGNVFATPPEPLEPAEEPPPPPAPAQSVFDGSPGVGTPPSTLGPYAMTSFGPDPQPIGDPVSSVAAPGGGSVGFSVPLSHTTVGQGWATWSHGYTGDVYIVPGGTGSITLTLPPNTQAFSFYAEPNQFELMTITATTQDGTTSDPVIVDGDSGAAFFGFSNTSTSSPITSITITCDDPTGFAIGEFAIATSPGTTSLEVPPEATVASTPPPEEPQAETSPSDDPPPSDPPPEG